MPCCIFLTSLAFTSAFSYSSLVPFGFKFISHQAPTAKPQPIITVVARSKGRSLLQVTTDSVSFSVIIATNDSSSTEALLIKANLTIEGFTSAAPPVYIPASCPANSMSPEGSISVTQCTCLPGYVGNASTGADCGPCPVDTFCASGKLDLCPAHAHAPALSDSIMDCSCYPGFYGNGSVSCSLCPSNSFCTGGFALNVCVQNAVSPAQSSANTSCYCDRGFYGVNNNPCVLCNVGSWCWTGIKNSCPANRSSYPGSSRISACVCLDGLVDTFIMDHDNQSTGVCTTCPENAFCKVLRPPNPVYNTHFHPPTHAHTSSYVLVFASIRFSHHLSRRPDLS